MGFVGPSQSPLSTKSHVVAISVNKMCVNLLDKSTLHDIKSMFGVFRFIDNFPFEIASTIFSDGAMEDVMKCFMCRIARNS
jgi:hypothetical protein